MVQPLNAVLDMYLTDSGIVIFVSDVHPEKAPGNILLTELGIVILIKLLQFLNISESIRCNESER